MLVAVVVGESAFSSCISTSLETNHALNPPLLWYQRNLSPVPPWLILGWICVIQVKCWNSKDFSI